MNSAKYLFGKLSRIKGQNSSSEISLLQECICGELPGLTVSQANALIAAHRLGLDTFEMTLGVADDEQGRR